MSAPDFTQTAGQKALIRQYDKCRDIWSGGIAAQSYLQKSTSESSAEFKSRQSISAAGTTYRSGINGVIDIIFRNPITLSTDMNGSIVDMYRTADGTRRLNEVTKEVLHEALLGNRCYALVWTPENTATNAEEEKQLGIRPYIEIITRDRIIDRITDRDDAGNITRIAIEGQYKVETGRYEVGFKPEWRVYFSNGLIETWRENSDTKEIYLYDSFQSSVLRMHIVEFIYSTASDIPPFVNEANLQIMYNNTHSDKFAYNKKLAFPFVKSWGMLQNSSNIAVDSFDENGNPVKIVEFQASKGIDFPVNPETGAKLGDVEIEELSGNADGVLKTSLSDIKEDIVKGFIRMFEQGASGNKTVEQSESERAAGEGMASNIAQGLEDFLEELNSLFHEMAGESVTGKITVNREFIKEILTDLRYRMLTDLKAENILDSESFIKELQKYGELDTIDAEELSVSLTAKGVV